MLILMLTAHLIIGASAILTAFPSNKVAVAGSKVILLCRTNTSKNLLWRQRLLNATEKDVLLDVIFTGKRLSNEAAQRYDIIRESAGQFDLKFNATLNHGNEYMCIEPGGYNFSSQIIVLASEPKCYVKGRPVTTNLIVVDEEEYVELKCILTFAGRWRPKMDWMQQVNSDNANQEETEKRGNTCFTSTTLGFNATHNETSFMCTTRFLEYDRPKTTTAENIPEYSYNWTSPTFVLWSFYKSNYMKQEIEHKDENIELKMKGMMWILTSCAAVACLVVFVVIVYYLRKHPDEIDGNLATESSAISAGRMPPANPDYEDVTVQLTATTVAEEDTADENQSRVKYCALIRSELTHPRTDYETINLTSTEAFLASQEHISDADGEPPSVEYVNIPRR